MYTINLIACIITLLFTFWAVPSPRFNDGIVMKLGLICVVFAIIAELYHLLMTGIAPNNQQTTLNVALALIFGSMGARRIFRPSWSQKYHIRPVHDVTKNRRAVG